MMSRLKSVCLCTVLAAVCGCDKKSDPAPSKGAGSSAAQGKFVVGTDARPIEALAAEDVIVAVNGVALKRKDYDALLLSIEQMYRAYNPKLRMADLETQRLKRAKTLVSEFITKQVLVQEARRRGVKATPEDRAGLQEVLQKLAKKEGMTVDELAKSDNPTVRIVREGVEDQALILALRQAEFGDRLKVTEADLQAARERIKRYNEMCEQTNVMVKARAQRICERLRNGEDFAKVAQETSEVKGDTKGVWGTFVRGEIEDALVRNAAFTVPVGGIAGPFDTSDGMIIIKVLERSGVDSPVATDGAAVTLGRVLLLLGETQKVLDDKTLRSELERVRLLKLQRPWLAELQSQARVEFPHGTNFWKKAKNRQ